MSIETVFNIMKTAVAVLEPLIKAGVTGNPKAERIFQKIAQLVNTATAVGAVAIGADRRLANRLNALLAELEGIKAAGGVKKADMTGLSQRVIDAESEFQAVVARRRAQAQLAG